MISVVSSRKHSCLEAVRWTYVETASQFISWLASTKSTKFAFLYPFQLYYLQLLIQTFQPPIFWLFDTRLTIVK